MLYVCVRDVMDAVFFGTVTRGDVDARVWEV